MQNKGGKMKGASVKKGMYLAVALLMLLLSAVPRVLNYQGKLTTTSGEGINDTLSMTFRLYTSATGGEPLWSQTIPNVPITRGLFSVELSGFPDSIDFSEQYWLEVEIDGEALSPREKLASAPYSLKSLSVEQAPNLDAVLTSGNSAGGKRLTSLGEPSDSSDATTKYYVDTRISSLPSLPSGTSGQTLRYDGTDWVANDVIYNDGTNVGIGTTTPEAKLEVAGEVKITGGSLNAVSGVITPSLASELGTDLFLEPGRGTGLLRVDLTNSTSAAFQLEMANGSILKIDQPEDLNPDINISNDQGGFVFLPTTNNYIKIDGTAPSMITGDGTASYFGGDVGIGTTTPGAKLEVAGQIKITGGSPGDGKVLVSDSTGLASWQTLTLPSLPSGTSGQTLRHDGTDWVANSTIYNDGTNVGIGTTSPSARLYVKTTDTTTVPLQVEALVRGGWLSGWSYRKQIIIDHTKIDSVLTDFPVLVKLTSSNFDFSKARSDGYDIRFTGSDGTTLLKYERERHDAANQVAEYWVKIPSVSSTSNTTFYIYYGNPTASDGADPTNVWDSNFKGVWHLKETGFNYISSVQINNLNVGNAPRQIDGKIGKGQDFARINSNTIANSSPINLPTGSSARTHEIWFRMDSNPPANDGFSLLGHGNNAGYGYRFNLMIWNNGINYQYGVETLNYVVFKNFTPDSNWHYLVASYPGGNLNTTKIYFDGQEVTPDRIDSFTPNVQNTEIRLGSIPGASTAHYHDGGLDEARISNIARSSAWIKASYHSGNNSLLTYGSEETISPLQQQTVFYIENKTGNIGIGTRSPTAKLDVAGEIKGLPTSGIFVAKNLVKCTTTRSTTSTTYVDFDQFTFNAPVDGEYLIMYIMNGQIQARGAWIAIRMVVDGLVEQFDLIEAGGNLAHSPGALFHVASLTAGNHTVKMQIKTSNSSYPAYYPYVDVNHEFAVMGWLILKL